MSHEIKKKKSGIFDVLNLQFKSVSQMQHNGTKLGFF